MIRAALISVFVASFIGGCAHEPPPMPEAPMTPASRTTSDNERSIFAITEQRCKREIRCENVGPDKSYSSEDDCRTQLNKAGYNSLGLDNCPAGIDPSALQVCLSSIQAEECGKPLDSIERMVDCRSGKLCAS